MTGKTQETDRLAVSDKRRRFRRVSVLPRRARTKDLFLLTELLRQLAACHASMVEGLARMAANCPNNQASMHLNRLAEHMQAGETLSGAMRQSPKFFPRYYIDLVEVAEGADQLAATLSWLMYEIQSRQQAGHKVRNRFAYITILLAYIVFVSSVLVSGAFPSVELLTTDLGGHVHGLPDFGMQIMGYTGFLSGVIGAANKSPDKMIEQLVNNGASPLPTIPMSVLLGGALLAAVFLLAALLLSVPGKYLFRQLPGIRRIILYAQWGHALRVLSLLLSRGVPLDRALDSAAGSDVQHGVQSALRRLSERVRSGQSFPEALATEGWRVPGSLQSAVAFGEHAGCLSESLSRVSHAYRLRAERAGCMLSNILFPLAIMGCGVLVLAIETRFFGLLCNSMDTLLYQI